MKRKRNSFLLFVVVIILTIALVGCSTPTPADTGGDFTEGVDSSAGEGNSPSGTSEETADSGNSYAGYAIPDEDVTLRIAVAAGAPYNSVKLSTDAFTELYPNIEFELEEMEVDTYEAQGARILTADENDFDMAWYWRLFQWADLCDSGSFMEIDDLYASQDWFSALGTDVTDLYKRPDGHYYSVPMVSTWIENVFYNEAIFEELGLSVPQSFDELYAMAGTIKAAGYTPMSVSVMNGNQEHHSNALLVRLLDSETYKKLLDPKQTEVRWDSDEMVALWTELKKLGDEVYQEGAAGQDADMARSLFLQGKSAMYVDGAWAIGQLENEKPDGFEYGYFAFPDYVEGETAPIIVFPGNAFQILSRTDQPEVCKAFLAFLISQDQQNALAESMSENPARIDISPESAAKMGWCFAACFEDMEKNGVTPLWSFDHTNEFLQFNNQTVQNVLVGSVTPQEAAESMQKMYESTLND